MSRLVLLQFSLVTVAAVTDPAHVGLLTGVRPLVSLEMTALGVDLQREAMIRVSDAMMLATLLTKIYMDMRLKNIK